MAEQGGAECTSCSTRCPDVELSSTWTENNGTSVKGVRVFEGVIKMIFAFLLITSVTEPIYVRDLSYKRLQAYKEDEFIRHW